jgi:hypothetical protein
VLKFFVCGDVDALSFFHCINKSERDAVLDFIDEIKKVALEHILKYGFYIKPGYEEWHRALHAQLTVYWRFLHHFCSDEVRLPFL